MASSSSSSSPGYHPPPHLHRVNRHPHGKRPFEECGGYDSDTHHPMPITTSGTSSSSNALRYAPAALPPNPETRNKRARSTSSSSTDDSSNPSSSGYNTAQSSSRSDLSSDGPPTLAVDCPVPPHPPFVATQDAHMSDLHLPVPPQRTHVPSPPVPEDTLRTSLQRFAEFDRQIAALRTSLAASTRSPPLPPLGHPLAGDPALSNDHWHPGSSHFLSNGPSDLPPSTAADIASTIPLASSDALNSLSTIPSADDAANVPLLASTASGSAPSTSFPPSFGNSPRYPPYPSYRPSPGGSSSLDRVPPPISSAPAPAFMRPTPNENTARVASRSSVAVDPSLAPSASHTRRVRENLSPLALPPDPSLFSQPSAVPDERLLRHRTANADGDGQLPPRVIDSPLPGQDRDISSSHTDARLGEQPRNASWYPDASPPFVLSPGATSQNRVNDRVRVIREHSVERESVPSVFDVFNLGESSQDRNRPPHSRELPPFRYASMPVEPSPARATPSRTERSRGHAFNVNQDPSSDTHSRLNASWASIPSSNSLMSESASERRQALAIERFRARFRQSSFEADDESDRRWSGISLGEHERDSALPSPVPLSPSVESMSTNSHLPAFGARAPMSTTNRTEPITSTTVQRSFSEFLAESERLFGWDDSQEAERERQSRERERQMERQRERTWEWQRERERQGERSTQDVRGRSFASGTSRTSTSWPREEVHPSVPGLSRPSLGQLGAGSSTIAATTAAANNNQQYSYSSLNLSSFQSGLFRDSLRRNAEVDQASFTSSGPAMPSTSMEDSRAASRLAFEDSGSDMDLDDFVRTRPPSPEWSRPYPYAGRTPPPPDYSPPLRNFSLRPGFSVLRRNNGASHETQGRAQQANRNTLSRLLPSPPAGPPRVNTYENSDPRPTASERTDRERLLPLRMLEGLYRSQEDGRRNASPGRGGTGQPYQPPPHTTHPHHALTPLHAVPRNERADAMMGTRSANGNGGGHGGRTGTEGSVEGQTSRRGSLGSTFRSRLARFANSQSSGSGVAEGPSAAAAARQRSPSHPIGARAQGTEAHRRASVLFGGAHAEHESRSVSGPVPWAESREVPWRAASGPRSGNTLGQPPTAPAGGAARGGEASGTGDEQGRSRLRTFRQRFQLDRAGEGMRAFRPGMLRAAIGRRGNLGDYVPDDLFDDSYEALLSLSSMLGEVRSRATPEEVIASLPTATFKEWKKDDSETRCPICLDDYEPLDVVTKLIECPHWLHKNCLEQWLRTANTCPVCREKVKASPKPAPAPTRRRPYRDSSSPSETNNGAASSASGNGGRPGNANTPSNSERPSFAAMVFNRMMNENDPWSTSPSHGPPGAREVRDAFLERLRAQQQQAQQRARAQEPSYPQFHHRAPAASQSGTLSRPSGGPGGPFGFMSLRGQGSDASIASTSSNVAVDEGRSEGMGRRTMVGTGGGSSSGSFLDLPTTRRESVFTFGAPSSSAGTFGGTSGPAQSGFEGVMSGSSELPREWRNRYEGPFTMESSRSSSSASSSSSVSMPMNVAHRLPIDEESSFEEPMIGWRVRLGPTYSYGGERRGNGEPSGP